jgi:lysozyme
MNDSLAYDQDGLDLTEDSEGCRLQAYPDPGTGADPWTIGYGHTGADVHPGLTIDHAQAEELLRHDMRKAEGDVKRFVEVALTQHQYDALVDFAFNCGGGNLQHSTLLRLVNAGDFAAASAHFSDWVKGGGHVLPGLVKRRHAETVLFES